MFRRNKHEIKAKLEHKLYLARETPEPVFDLSDCELKIVPHGIYSLCKVFLKEALLLNQNCLSSLSGGGNLKDLHLIKVLDLHENNFTQLPEEICFLKNLRELYLNNNHLKKLPGTICQLSHLKILNVACNSLKNLPEEFGELTALKSLSLNSNKHLNQLPKSMWRQQKLTEIHLDSDSFIYPPKEILAEGAEAIIQYICKDVGMEYSPQQDENRDNISDNDNNEHEYTDFEAKIRTLENIKKQRLGEFLELERANEELQRQEFEIATALKLNRVKLLADITEQQNKIDKQVSKIQQIKEMDRFRLIEQIQEAEHRADVTIKQLLQLSREPLAQLLEQEKNEEERLIAAACKYNEALRTNEILANMQDLLQQETNKFERLHEDRLEISRSILEQELVSHGRLAEILQDLDLHKAEMISKLLFDSDLQKAAVCTLLERGDARSWGLIQQVRLVESQLAALTHIEIDKKKLEIDQQLSDLEQKRLDLSVLLMDLLQQQRERRAQLLSTLQRVEESSDVADDFWLRQYQRLLDKLPEGLSEAQKNIDPALAQALLVNDAIHCLPFLAKLTQSQYNIESITENDLLQAGVVNRVDRLHILDAFQMYKKEKSLQTPYVPTAPVIPLEEASAPPPEQQTTITTSECVICLDNKCEIIYVPCGHLCCCPTCSTSINDCPLCRSSIEHKIRVVAA